ncbi:Calcineurin b protein 10 [Globisporangium polare]
MNFDDTSGPGALFSMLSATTSSSNNLSAAPTATTTSKFPIKPQHPHPRTSVAATADFLDVLRSRSLLDYSFMREFSLARKKPVAERSLSKMSAGSIYSMRMAQLSLEETTRSFTGRQQWLMKPEPLQGKGEDEVRASTPVAQSIERRFKRRNLVLKKPPPRSPTVLDESDSCFPTLWGSSETQHQVSVDQRRALGHWAPQQPGAKRAAPESHRQHHHPQSNAATTPQSSVLIPQDLSEFDMRKCHPSSVVAQQHGFLTEQDIPQLMEQTGYSRTELYALWARFKALCSISKVPKGIDKDTFHRGIPQLSVEDDFFIDRVFTILDADGSGILEWQEFVEALSSLEKGDVAKRVGFLFRVYDLNGDGTIHRSEAIQFFLASLLVSANDEVEEVARHFINKIFAAVGCTDRDAMRIEDAMQYMAEHPSTDIYSLFGRTMVSKRQQPILTDVNTSGTSKTTAADPMASIIG